MKETYLILEIGNFSDEGKLEHYIFLHEFYFEG